MDFRRWIVVTIAALAAITTVQASHQETGGTVNSTRQYLVCTAVNDFPTDQPFKLTFFDGNGDAVLSKEFAAIADNAIAHLIYTGLANPVSCEWESVTTDDRMDTSLNLIDRRTGKVVALMGNHNTGDHAAVVNSRHQYPVCVGRCNSTECDFELSWYDAQGNELDSEVFDDVSERGTGMLYYTGARSPVWCEQVVSNGFVGSTVQLVDRRNGRVDASHTNEFSTLSRRSGAVVNDNNQTPVCLGRCWPHAACNFDVTVHGPSGEVLETESFVGVPAGGIRRVAYSGLASPVSCETTGTGSRVGLSLLDKLDGRVQALIGNGISGDSPPVVNSPKQYPVCVASCSDSGTECGLEASFLGEEGQVVATASWDDVPEHGSRALYYQGGEPNVWCEVTASPGFHETNIVMVNKVTGEVEAIHRAE